MSVWCDTPRPSGTPLREGMATQYFDWYLFTHTDRRPNRYRDIPSRRGVPEGRGVSHSQTKLITENANIKKLTKTLL